MQPALQSPLPFDGSRLGCGCAYVYILDYEDDVRLTGQDGTRVTARLTGVVEPRDAYEAGLGHDEVSLAFQRWRNLRVTTQQPIPFTAISLTFVDGSSRAVRLAPEADADGVYTYAVELTDG